MLSSFCLVHSVAYPPPSELDDHLKAFIISPKASIDQIWHLDSEAAELLSTHLSGYATLRKFYELRDEEVNLKPGEKPAHRRNERRRAAAAALMALISSASASIRGGLYDPSDETVVQVDGLLALLGEALPFIKRMSPIIQCLSAAYPCYLEASSQLTCSTRKTPLPLRLRPPHPPRRH